MNPADYPAAHSMDTDWFAVDAEGHVALMKSGEPGPVPVGLESQRGGWDVLKALALANPSALFGRHCADDSRHWGLVMLLRDAADLAAPGAAAPGYLEVGPTVTAGENSGVAVSMLWISGDEFVRPQDAPADPAARAGRWTGMMRAGPPPPQKRDIVGQIGTFEEPASRLQYRIAMGGSWRAVRGADATCDEAPSRRRSCRHRNNPIRGLGGRPG
jgi:hypothetical protein